MLFIVNLFIFSAAASPLPPHHSSECAAILMETTKVALSPNMAEQTFSAFKRLSDFQRNQTPPTLLAENPSYQLSLDSNSASPKDLEDLNAPLNTLASHYSHHKDPKREKKFNYVVGYEIHGKEAIAAFLERIQANAFSHSKWKKAPTPNTNALRITHASARAASLLFVYALLHGASNALNEAMQGNYKNLFFIPLNLLSATWFLETFVRAISMHDWKFKKDYANLKSFLQEPSLSRHGCPNP